MAEPFHTQRQIGSLQSGNGTLSQEIIPPGRALCRFAYPSALGAPLVAELSYFGNLRQGFWQETCAWPRFQGSLRFPDLLTDSFTPGSGFNKIVKVFYGLLWLRRGFGTEFALVY